MTKKKARIKCARILRAHGASWANSHKLARIIYGDAGDNITVDKILEVLGYDSYESNYVDCSYSDPLESGYEYRYHLVGGGYLYVNHLGFWRLEDENKKVEKL
jgi:hypothetical protein